MMRIRSSDTLSWALDIKRSTEPKAVPRPRLVAAGWGGTGDNVAGLCH